ncbi:MAG: exostosin family protein [Candidatus Peribacteraceae bacterium]|nr:exostosin family protein [Candidatus Peribacteraceae bacterium]
MPPETKSSIAFTYLPIFWTNYYYARIERQPSAKIQQFFDVHIDAQKRYFTIVQAASGITEPTPGNLLTFAAGGVGDIPIPLLCNTPTLAPTERDILASFVGVIDDEANNKTGIRSVMRDCLQHEQDFFILHARNNAQRFHEMMHRSVFALCPRGFGKTSFRMYEAINMGTIPVYIYDEPWLPYTEFLDWEECSVLVPKERIAEIPAILRFHSPEDIRRKQQKLRELKEQGYFSFRGVCHYIIQQLRERS